MSSVHIIGHSLGAHVAGYAGYRLLYELSVVRRITGLDPARPYFEYKNNLVKLDQNDAQFVDIIHTDSSTDYLSTDYQMKVGDIFPSFIAFKDTLLKFQEKTGTVFIRKDSRKDNGNNVDFPYQYVSYHCKHGKIRASESKGIRPNQIYDAQLTAGRLQTMKIQKCTRMYNVNDSSDDANAIYHSLTREAAKRTHDQLILFRKNSSCLPETTTTKCSCSFYKSFQLPCKHIFSARDAAGLQIFVEDNCSQRFLLKKQSTSYDTNITGSSSKSVIKEALPLNPETKYSIAKGVLADIASYISLLGTKEFCTKIEYLKNLLSGWKEGKSYFLQEIEASDSSLKAANLDDSLVFGVKNNDSTYSENTLSIPAPDVHVNKSANFDDSLVSGVENNNSTNSEDILSIPAPDAHVNTTQIVQTSSAAEHCTDFILPSKLKTKGRPRNKQFFTSRKRKVPKEFVTLGSPAKISILFSAAVKADHTHLKQVTSEDSLKTASQLGSSLLQAKGDAEKLCELMVPNVFSKLKYLLKTKEQQNLWLCKECGELDCGKLEMVLCEHCLEWFHYSCVNYSQRKSVDKWFCPKCWGL